MLSLSGSSRSSKSKSDKADSAASDASERRSQEIRQFQSAVVENKSCFDCGQRGPTYLNMTVGSFVCTKCSGMLRGLTPPHRIKSLSMSSFSHDEVNFIRSRGNVWAAKVFMGLCEGHKRELVNLDEDGVRDFMIEKYEKKRYYVDPSNISHEPFGGSGETKNGQSQSFNLIGATLNATLNARKAPGGSAGGVVDPAKTAAISRPPAGNSGTVSGQSRSTPPVVQTSNSQQLLAELTASVKPVTSSPDPFGQVSSTSSMSLPKASESSVESFANFDNAQFEPAPVAFPDPSPAFNTRATPPILATSAVKAPVAKPSAPVTASAPPPVAATKAEDKYAALKDLDDIFRTSVAINDAPAPINSTGLNIFGNSATQASGSLFGGAATTSPQNVFGDSNQSGAVFGTSPSPAWPGQENTSGTNGTKSPLSNPFAAGPAAANAVQLNTSPWPTTGNSPVNTIQSSGMANSNNQWPPAAFPEPQKTAERDPFASINLQSELNKADAKMNNTSSAFSPMSDNVNGNAFPIQGNDGNNFQAFFNDISSAATTAVAATTNGNPWSNASPVQVKKSTNPFL